MAGNSAMDGGGSVSPWRITGWGAAVALLLLPAVAMQFTTEVAWDLTDFIVAGVLLGSVGLGIEFLVRRSDSLAYRLGSAVAVLSALLLVWVNLAVGMIGSEGSTYNLLFGAVIGIAAVGALLARFRPAGMARAMLAAAAAQGVIAAGGLATDPQGGTLALLLAGSWLLAAALFGKAARELHESRLA